MTLTEEIENAKAAQQQRETERKQHDREYAQQRVRTSVNYTFGQEPDSVRWDATFGAVANVDGIEMALTHKSSTPTMAIVCTCEQCGQRFLSFDTFGTDKNHYSASSERPLEFRRQAAVETIAKVAARNFQPNNWGHDHKCDAVVARKIPVRLLDRIDAILIEEGVI